MILIWTDGSCHPNPGPGGWAWHDGNKREEFGGEPATTSNRMELIAILMAMRAHEDDTQLTIHSDSQYCVNGLTVWSPGRKRSDPRLTSGAPGHATPKRPARQPQLPWLAAVPRIV